MARYRVLLRREYIEETWVEVEAGGHQLASDKAVAKAHVEEGLVWTDTGTLNRQPYAVTYERVPQGVPVRRK